MKLPDDLDARVRFQCALSLGELSGAKKIPPLAQIASRHCEDKWFRAAALSSVNGHAGEFLMELINIGINSKTSDRYFTALVPLLNELGRILGTDPNTADFKSLRRIVTSEDEKDSVWQLAVFSGFADGLRALKRDAGGQSVFMSLVPPEPPWILRGRGVNFGYQIQTIVISEIV